jgi:hypothetical protein
MLPTKFCCAFMVLAIMANRLQLSPTLSVTSNATSEFQPSYKLHTRFSQSVVFNHKSFLKYKIVQLTDDLLLCIHAPIPGNDLITSQLGEEAKRSAERGTGYRTAPGGVPQLAQWANRDKDWRRAGGWA